MREHESLWERWKNLGENALASLYQPATMILYRVFTSLHSFLRLIVQLLSVLCNSLRGRTTQGTTESVHVISGEFSGQGTVLLLLL